jgi:hypothetical protein
VIVGSFTVMGLFVLVRAQKVTNIFKISKLGLFMFLLVFVMSTFYLVLPFELKFFGVLNVKERDLTSDYPFKQVRRDSSWITICPECGSEVKYISMSGAVICAWEGVYYCRHCDIFWYGYGSAGFGSWYGPYSANLTLKNSIAATISVLSLTTLGILAFKGKNEKTKSASL